MVMEDIRAVHIPPSLFIRVRVIIDKEGFLNIGSNLPPNFSNQNYLPTYTGPASSVSVKDIPKPAETKNMKLATILAVLATSIVPMVVAAPMVMEGGK